MYLDWFSSLNCLLVSMDFAAPWKRLQSSKPCKKVYQMGAYPKDLCNYENITTKIHQGVTENLDKL